MARQTESYANMSNVPVGFLFTVVILAWFTWWAVFPRRTPRLFASLSFAFGLVINELPFLALLWLIAASALAFDEGDLQSSASWVIFGLALLTGVGLLVVIWRGLRAIPVIRRALADGLGPAWQDTLDGQLAARSHPRFRITALLGPFFRRSWAVERIANMSYGDAGESHLLDVYRHRSQPTHAPVFIHFHGRGRLAQKNREALPLLYRLASQGWVSISANYREGPVTTSRDQLIDAKKVIAWVRNHGAEYGADISAVFIAGGSAGAQLAAQAALTPNDRRFQPGFEPADTSVAAAIALYGYYGWSRQEILQESVESSSVGTHRAAVSLGDVPPILVVHGDRDTVLPVEDARRFVRKLRGISRNPVVYVELPGAQHNFDLFHSIRNEAVIDGIEVFASWVRAKANTRQDQAETID